MSNKVISLIYLLLILTILTSCWDSIELTRRAIVAGVGIDKGNNGDIVLSIQLLKPGKLKSGGSGGEKPIAVLTSQGPTMFEAIRQFTKQASRKLYWEHNRLIVFSEEIAREGLSSYIDMFMRDPDIRRRSIVVICPDKASKIMEASSNISKIPAEEILALSEAQKATSEVAVSNLFSMALDTNNNYKSPVTAFVQLKDNYPVFIGTAIFKKDKLMGYLNAAESRGYQWLVNKVESGILVVNSPSADDSKISLEIQFTKTEITPKFNDGKWSLDIKVSAITTLGETMGDLDTKYIQTFDQLCSLASQEIESEIKACLQKTQNKYKTDIFGFGNLFYRKFPKQWQQIEDQWPDILPQIEINYKADVMIEHTGLITKPIGE